jgi:hypothetical protein
VSVFFPKLIADSPSDWIQLECGIFFVFYVTLSLCVSCDTEGREICSMKLYYLDVTLLNINKTFPYRKKYVFLTR